VTDNIVKQTNMLVAEGANTLGAEEGANKMNIIPQQVEEDVCTWNVARPSEPDGKIA
jgi:hypothetical protein